MVRVLPRGVAIKKLDLQNPWGILQIIRNGFNKDEPTLKSKLSRKDFHELDQAEVDMVSNTFYIHPQLDFEQLCIGKD